MKATVTLYDEALDQVVLSMARSYAMRVIQSRLDGTQMWNEPWYRRRIKFGEWMAEVDAERRAYGMSLLSLGFEVLPNVPQPEWRMLPLDRDNKRKVPSYNPTAVGDTAKEWARNFLVEFKRNRG